MSVRKIRDESEARACIAKMAESGLTLSKWSRSAGIDGRSLHAWRTNLARGEPGLKKSAVGARKVRRAKLIELVPMTSSRSSRYIVQVGPHAVEVDDHFTETTLRRLIVLLRSC
jgi:hypothetical protein